MAFLFSLYQEPVWFITALIVVSLWNLIWKGLGLWYAGKHQQKGWFIAMLIIDLVGLLPIIYLVWFKPQEKLEEEAKSVSVRKKSSRRAKK
ncbi:MAG TPA: DUF5652 family protein [Candidatus Nanoarchaeia archaeon]|nr:DUF5652 family protein [Candidatus Nanoarchaeia archaeon]